MGQSNLVSGFAAVFRTGPQATAAYARVIKPALSRCLRVLFEKESTKALKVHVLSVRQSPVGSVQARADAYRITARFTGSGVSLLAHLDFVFLQRGRAVAGVLVLRFPQPVDPRLEARVVGAIDRRSAAA
jgi:hypothetical protein